MRTRERRRVARLSGVGPVWVILGVGRRSGWARGARPATSGRPGRNRGGKGEKREREQREKDGIDSKFEFFSKISVET